MDIAPEPLFYSYHCAQVVDSILNISGIEASHILKSRRKKNGDRLYFTDGNGTVVAGFITKIDKKQLSLQIYIDETHSIPPSQQHEIILVTPCLKTERQSVLLDMATQLGISAYHSLLSDYSNKKSHKEGKIKRLERIVANSSKQCRRVYFPKIELDVTLKDVFSLYVGAKIIYAQRNGCDMDKVHSFIQSKSNLYEKIVIIVGPEGGFSQKELLFLEKQSCVSLHLGNNILRAETAAISAINIISQIIRCKK